MVIVLIANLKVGHWNIEILHIFYERSIYELNAFRRKNWSIHIYMFMSS
jgi:hypothetical protein